jgi:hypothetical protein
MLGTLRIAGCMEIGPLVLTWLLAGSGATVIPNDTRVMTVCHARLVFFDAPVFGPVIYYRILRVCI